MSRKKVDTTLKKFRVWLAPVEPTYYEVDAYNEEYARGKAQTEWKRAQRPEVMYVERPEYERV